MATKQKGTKPSSNGKPKKVKQQHLPGLEPPTIKEIDTAADEYVEMRDGRMALSKKEATAQDKLLDLMKKHGLQTYHYDGRTVSLVEQRKVKVKRNKVEVEDEE